MTVRYSILASVVSAYNDPEGEYDFVINLAAETKYGQTDAVSIV
jgi:hypothetical protein